MKKSIVFFFFIAFNLYAQVPHRPTMEVANEIGVKAPRESGNRYSIFRDKENKVGYKRNDTVIIKPIYDEIDFRQSVLVLRKDKKRGVANRNGEILIPITLDSVYVDYNTDAIIVCDKGKYGSFDDKGNSILPIKYPKIVYSNPVSNVSLVKNEKENTLDIYLFDKKTKYTSNAIFLFTNAMFFSHEGKYGLFIDGKQTLDFEYDAISIDGKPIGSSYTHLINKNKFVSQKKYLNIYIVEKDKKFGVNFQEKVIFPVELDKASYDNIRQIVQVEKGKLKGAYLVNSKKIIEPKYQNIYLDGTQYIELKENNKVGMFTYALDTVIPIAYDDIQIQGFNSGFKVMNNKKKGWFSRKGEEIIPIIYDDIEDFSLSNLKDVFSVKQDGKYGLINKKNEVLIPVQYEHIFDKSDLLFVVTPEPERKFGLYNSYGKEILPAVYDFITDTDIQKSKTILAVRNGKYTLVDEKLKIIFPDKIIEHSYLLDTNLLKTPPSIHDNAYLRLKNIKNRVGLFNEHTGKLEIPFEYDDIIQECIMDGKTLFLTLKKGKYGIIDNKNTVLIPNSYDNLDLTFQNYNEEYKIFPAQKKGKYGLIDNHNKVILPFQYEHIAKLSYDNLFKAKKDGKYSLIDEKGTILNAGPFDDIANFEEDETLTFYKGDMKVMNKKGIFTGLQGKMDIHEGYATFDILKEELIKALDSKEDDLLKTFANNIAPSKHLLFYINKSRPDKNDLLYLNIEDIKEKYFQNLLEFKYQKWNNYYKKSSLTKVVDYTIYSSGIVTNRRATGWAFGDSFLEKLLRNSLKVNGYWISTYFMYSRF